MGHKTWILAVLAATTVHSAVIRVRQAPAAKSTASVPGTSSAVAPGPAATGPPGSPGAPVAPGAAAGGMVSWWEQCGGVEWKGATTCQEGARCDKVNEYYSQCNPVTSGDGQGPAGLPSVPAALSPASVLTAHPTAAAATSAKPTAAASTSAMLSAAAPTSAKSSAAVPTSAKLSTAAPTSKADNTSTASKSSAASPTSAITAATTSTVAATSGLEYSIRPIP